MNSSDVRVSCFCMCLYICLIHMTCILRKSSLASNGASCSLKLKSFLLVSHIRSYYFTFMCISCFYGPILEGGIIEEKEF